MKTRTVELPSDSTFAIAMKTQQAAEREEQQRIKSLVLNYDLRDGEEQDGDLPMAPLYRNPNIYEDPVGLEKATATNFRPDKSGNNRSGQRARKLQLSDVDWYASNSVPSQPGSPGNFNSDPAPGKPRAVPLGAKRQPSVLPNSNAVQQRSRGPVHSGRLTRKEILREHASRKVTSKSEGDK
jgi:regulator of nonsense transcripts 2